MLAFPEPEQPAPFPEQPRSDLEQTLPAYCDDYKAWLAGHVAPALLQIGPGDFDGETTPKRVTDWCVQEVQHRTPRGHGTDAAKNGVSTLARWLATQGWSLEFMTPQCRTFLADPAASTHGQAEVLTEAIAVVVGVAYPLHALESVVRKAAWDALIGHARNLDRNLRDIYFRNDGFKTLSQRASQKVLTDAIVDAKALRDIATTAPTEAMQRAWLEAEWPKRRNKLIADTSNHEPEVREEIATWIEEFENLHTYLKGLDVPTPTPVSDVEAWGAYLRGQLEALDAHVLGDGQTRPAGFLTQPRSERGTPSLRLNASLTDDAGVEAVTEALRLTVGFLERHPGLAVSDRDPNLWRLTFEENLGWCTYREAQLLALDGYIFSPAIGETAARAIRPYVLYQAAIDGADEVVAEAVRTTQNWFLNRDGMPLEERAEKRWYWKYLWELKTARIRQFRRAIEIDISDHSEAFSVDDEVRHDAVSSAGVTELHIHVCHLWLESIAAGDVGPTEAARARVRTAASCINGRNDCHGADQERRLAEQLRRYEPQELSDEIEYHLAEEPTKFLPIGTKSTPGIALLKKIIRAHGRNLRSNQPPGQAFGAAGADETASGETS